MRVITTADDERGHAIVARDEDVPPVEVELLGEMKLFQLWGSDATPSLPTNGEVPEYDSYFPPPGGVRLHASILPPHATVSTDASPPPPTRAQLDELQAKLPGLLDHVDESGEGFHTTDTIDFGLCVSGEVVLRLDDGVEVQVTPGSIVVQNGTRHSWVNRGTQPCVMVFVSVGARRVST
jgi:hypothetical protein